MHAHNHIHTPGDHDHNRNHSSEEMVGITSAPAEGEQAQSDTANAHTPEPSTSTPDRKDEGNRHFMTHIAADRLSDGTAATDTNGTTTRAPTDEEELATVHTHSPGPPASTPSHEESHPQNRAPTGTETAASVPFVALPDLMMVEHTPTAQGQGQDHVYHDEHGTIQCIVTGGMRETSRGTPSRDHCSQPHAHMEEPTPQQLQAPATQTHSAAERGACVGESIHEVHGGRPSHFEPWLPTRAQAKGRYNDQVAAAYQEAKLIKMENINDKIVISVNVNGFKTKLEAWKKREGKFYEMITNLNPDIILVGEAHYSQKDDIAREQDTMVDLLELNLGGRWKVHISPCRLGVGYAGTMAMIRTTTADEEAEDWVCSSYIGPTGAPFPGKLENLKKWADAEPWTQAHGQPEGRYTILWDNADTVSPHVMVVMYGVYPKRGDIRGGPANALIQEVRKLIDYLKHTFDDPTITVCGDTNTFEGPESFKLEGVEEVSGTPVSSLITQHLRIWTGETGLAGANRAAQDRHAALKQGRGEGDTILHTVTEQRDQSRASVQMMAKFANLQRSSFKDKSKQDLRSAMLPILNKQTEAEAEGVTTVRKLAGGETVNISTLKFHEEPRTFLMRLDHVLTTHPEQITPITSAEYSSLVTNADRMCHTDHAAVIFSMKRRGDGAETRRAVPTPAPIKATNSITLSQNQILEGFSMAAGYALEEEAVKCAMYIPQGDLITKAEEATGRVLAYTAARTAKMIRLVSKRAWEEPTAERLRQAPPTKEKGRIALTAFAKAERQGTTPHESQERGVGPEVTEATKLDPAKESHLHPTEIRAAPVTAISRRAQALHDLTTRIVAHEKYVPHQHIPPPVNSVAFINLVSQVAGETGMPLTNAIRATRIHLGEKRAQSESPSDKERVTEEFKKACNQLLHSTDVIRMGGSSGLTIARRSPQQGGERGEKPTPVGAQEDPAGLAQEPDSRRAPQEAARLAGWSRMKAMIACAEILHRRAREHRRTHISTATADGNLISDITRLDTVVGRLVMAQREFINTGTVTHAGHSGRSSSIKHCTQRLSKTAALLALKIESSIPAWQQARNKAKATVEAKEIRRAWGHLMRGTLIQSWHREAVRRLEQTEKIANMSDLGIYLKPTIGSDNEQRLNKLMTLFRIDPQREHEETAPEKGGLERGGLKYGMAWGCMIATGDDIRSYLEDDRHDKDELWHHLMGRHRAKSSHTAIDAAPAPATPSHVIEQRWTRVIKTCKGVQPGANAKPPQGEVDDGEEPDDQPEAPKWRFHLRCGRPGITNTPHTAGTPIVNPRTVSDHLEEVRRRLRRETGATSAWAWHKQPADETEEESKEGEMAYLEVYHDLRPEEASWVTRALDTITPEMSTRVVRYYHSRTAPPPQQGPKKQSAAKDGDDNHLHDRQKSAGARPSACKWRICGSTAQMDPDNHRQTVNSRMLTLRQLLQEAHALRSAKRQHNHGQDCGEGEPPPAPPATLLRPPKRKQVTANYIRRMGGTWNSSAIRGGQPSEVNLLEDVGAPFYTSAYIGRPDDLNHRIKCTVLIDSGCATEFISDKMAEKLRAQSIINDNDYIKATEIRAQSAFGQDEHTKGALQLGLSLNHIGLTEDGDIRGQRLHNHTMAARVLSNLQVDLIIGARGIRHHGICIPGELEDEDVTGWVGSPIQIGPKRNPTEVRCHTHARWQVGDQAPAVARENITWAAQGTKQLIKLGIQVGSHMVADLKRRMDKAKLARRPQKYYMRMEPINDDPTQAQVHMPTITDITFEKSCKCTGTCGCNEEVVATAIVESGTARGISDLPPGTLLGTAILECEDDSEAIPVHEGVSADNRIQAHADRVGQLMAVNILSTEGQVRLDSKKPLHWHSQKILHEQSEADKRTLTSLWKGDSLRGLASLQATEAHRVVGEYLRQHVIIAGGGGDTVIVNPTNAGRTLAELASMLEVAYKTAPYIIGPATQHHEWQKLAKLIGNPSRQMQEPEPGTEWAIQLIKDSMQRIFHIKRAMASKLKASQDDEAAVANDEISDPTHNNIGLATIEASTMAWHQHLAGTANDVKDKSSMVQGSSTRTDITRCTGRAWKLLSQGCTIEATPKGEGHMKFKVNTDSRRRPRKHESHVTTAIQNAITLHGHRLRHLTHLDSDDQENLPPCMSCTPEQGHKGGLCGCHKRAQPFKMTVKGQHDIVTAECNKMSVAERAPEALEHHLQRQKLKLADREAAQQEDGKGERIAKTEEVGIEDPSTSPPAAMSRVDCYAGARAKIPPHMPSEEARKRIWWWPRESIANERALLQKLLKLETDKKGGGLRRLAYLQSVQFDDEMKQQLEDPDVLSKEAESDDPSTPHNMRRARAHLHVWNCTRNFKTIDVDPYNGPTIDTAILGPEFLTLTTKEAIFDPPRQLPPDAVEQANDMVDYMVRSGQAIEATSSFNHNVLLVPKKQDRNTTQKSWRLCNDLRRLNEKTLRTHWRLLPTMSSLEAAAGFDRFSVSDAVSGYYQCRIDPSISHKFSFSVGNRRLVPTKSLMGGLNSGALYCLAMARAIGHMNTGICELDRRNRLIKRDPNLLEAAKQRYKEGIKVLGDGELTWEPASVDEKDMQEWVERSLDKPRPTIEQCQRGEDDWHECDGILLDDIRHRCRAMSYVDDVIVAGKDNSTGTEQENAITFSRCNARVLEQLGTHGAMLKAQKTTFDTNRLEFLGWEIGPEGLQPSIKKINAFTKMCRPRNKDELQRFIGCTQYFRNTIPAISLHEAPLYDLTKKGVTWKWTSVEDAAFNEIKRLLSSDTVLARRNPDCDYLILAVDSSTIGTGAVLSQVVGGKEEAIAYISTTFKNGSSWSGTEKEVTGILWAIQEVKQLIHDKRLIVVTDHRPVKSIVAKRNLNAKLHRMVLAIQDIDCEFEHREGKKMIVPDTLSRLLDYADLYDSVEGEILQTQHHLSTFEADETEKIVAAKQEREGAGVEHLKQQRWGADQLQGEGTLDLEKRTLVRGLTLGSLRQCRKHIDQWRDKHDQIAKAITEGATKIISEKDEKADIAKQATGLRGQAEERLLSSLGGLEKLINLAADDEGCSARMEEQYGEDYLERIYPHRNEDGSIDIHIWEETPEGNSSTRDILQAEGIKLEDQPDPAAIVASIQTFQQAVDDLRQQTEELETEAHDQLNRTIDAFTIEGIRIMEGMPTQEREVTQSRSHASHTELEHLPPPQCQVMALTGEEERILRFSNLTQEKESTPVVEIGDEVRGPDVGEEIEGMRDLEPDLDGAPEHAPQEPANGEVQEVHDQGVETETPQRIADALPLGVSELLWKWTSGNNVVDLSNIQTQDRESPANHEPIPPVAADLFAGAGGGIGAFIGEGFRAGACCEQGYAQQLALKDRYGIEAIKDWGDMRPHHFRGAFAVISCSPCTTFSTAGHKDGLEHRRGQYYPKQVQEAARARVPLIVIENVERVTEDMPYVNPQTGRTERESPMNLLKRQLAQQGYVTQHEILDAGSMGGKTRKCRAILQAMLPGLQQHCRNTHGATAEAKQSYLQGRGMAVTHRIDEQGFIWPRHTGEKTSIGEIMIPWDQRPESHKLRVGEWSHFDMPRTTNRDGAIRLGNRHNDGSIGDRDNPNRVYSHEGRAPGITAMGNTGWYLVPEAAPTNEVKRLHAEGKEAWGIVRLTGEEVKQMAGFTGIHDLTQHSSTIFSEDELHKMVNNALDFHLSRRLAQGARCMYDEQWMKRHVKDTERSLNEGLGYDKAVHEAKGKLKGITLAPSTLQNIVGEGERNVIIKSDKAINGTEAAAAAIMQDLHPRKVVRDQRALYNTTVRAQHAVDTYLREEASLVAGGAPSTRAPAAGRQAEQEEPKTEGRQSTNCKDRKYRIHISTLDKEVTKENVILRDSTSTMGDVGRHIPRNGIRQAQREDRELRILMDFAETGNMPIEDPIDRGVLNTKEEYVMHNDILYHIGRLTGKSHTAEDEIEGDYYMQLVVPQSLRSKLVKDYHANLGHASAKSVSESLKSRYWWPAMSRDIDLVVSECDTCQRYKATRPTCGGIKMQLTEEAGRPWETIWMDFIGPYGRNSTKKANTCALVIVDDFSRWIEATPCTNSDSKTVAETLRGWILRHGFPRHIKSDRGSSLISKPMQLLYSSMGISKSESASLHPQSHGKVERANKHIQSCLRTHTAKGDMEWDDALMNAAASWNWSQKGISGLSPYQIVHGYRPRMEFNDLDATAPDTSTKFSNTNKWVQTLMEQHTDLCNKLADEHLNFKLKYIQAHNDQIKPSESSTFEVGQKVRVFLPATSSRTGLASKLQARYTTAYTVVKQITEHTYRVKKDNDKRPSVAVHANRLARYRSTSARTTETTAQCEIENLSDDTEEIDRALSDLILGLSAESEVEGEHRANAERALAKYRHKGDLKPVGLDQARAILDEMGEQFGDLEQRIKSGEWEFVCSDIERSLRGDTPQQKREATPPDEELGDLEGHTLEAPPEPSNVEDQADIGNVEPTQRASTTLRRHSKRTNPVRCITWTNPTTTVRLVAQQIKADCKTLERDLAKHWVGAPPNHATRIKRGMKIPIQGQKKGELRLSRGCKVTMEHPNEVGNQVREWKVTEITDQRTFKPDDPADGTTPTLHYHVTWDEDDLGEGESPKEWIPVGRLTGCSEVIQRFKDKQSVSAVHIKGGQPHEILMASQTAAHWETHPLGQASTDTKEQADQRAQAQKEIDQLMKTLPTAVAEEGHDMVIWDAERDIPQEAEQAIQQRCGIQEILHHTGMEPVLAAPIILSSSKAEEHKKQQQNLAEAELRLAELEDEQTVRDNPDAVRSSLRRQSNHTGEYVRLNVASPGASLARMSITTEGTNGPAKIIDLREHMRRGASRWEQLRRCIQCSNIWGAIISPDHLAPEEMRMWKDMIIEGDICHIICSRAYTSRGLGHKRAITRWLLHQGDTGGHDKVASLIARSPELAPILQPEEQKESLTGGLTATTWQTADQMLTSMQSHLIGGNVTVTTREYQAWNMVKGRIVRHHMLRDLEEPDDMVANISVAEAVAAVKAYISCHTWILQVEPSQPPSTMEAAIIVISTVARQGWINTQQGGRTRENPRETLHRPEFETPEEATEWTLRTVSTARGGLTLGELLERTATQRYLQRRVLDLINEQQLEVEPRGAQVSLNSRLTISDTQVDRTNSAEQSAVTDTPSDYQRPAEKEQEHASEVSPTQEAAGEDAAGDRPPSPASRATMASQDQASQGDGQAAPSPPQIRMLICHNPHPQGTIRIITTPAGDAPEGSLAAQHELATALSHKARRVIASREIKDQTGLSAKSQKEHLYSKEVENCLHANQRHTLEGGIIKEGNTHHIVYIASHLGAMKKTIQKQTHRWTNLQHVNNVSAGVRSKVLHLLQRQQQIRTSETDTMEPYLYMATCAGRGEEGEQTTLYTTKAFPQGKTLGNLYTGTVIAPEGYISPEGSKVMHRVNEVGKMDLLRRTPRSNAVWELAGRERSHNCDITADGSVVTTRVIRKGETLTLSYGYLPEASSPSLVRGGQTEQQQHWHALDDWAGTVTADEGEADMDPDKGRKLWEHAASLGEEIPTDAKIGSFTARTDRVDLPVILQALHNDEEELQRGLQAQQKSLADAIANRDITALTIAAWSLFRRVAKEDTQRVVASAKSKMMKSNLAEVIDLLKRTEVNNSGTAREWERVFLQSTCKALIDATKQDEELRFNFLMCLTYAEEAQEAASKKQMTEEQALRNIPVIWYITSSTLMCTLRVHPHHLKSSRMAFTKGAEITIRVKNKDAPTVAKGTIDEISNTDASGLQSMTVTVERATGSTEGKAIADITPIYRSAQGMYQRTSLHRIWKSSDDLKDEFQDVRDFLMGRDTKTLEAGAFRRYGEAWETLRRDRGHPEHTEDQTEIMHKVWSNSYTLAQGPPGTGKSRTAVDVIARALHVKRDQNHKGKILVVVPTNVTAQDYVTAIRGATLPGDDAPIRLVWVLGHHWEKRAEEEAAKVSLSQYTIAAPNWIRDYLKRTHTKAEQEKLFKMHTKRENGDLADGDEAEYYRLRNQAQKRVLSQAEVLVMTTQQAGKKTIRDLAKSERLALRVIDESGMIGENDLSVVLALRCWRTLVIGDHEQLPARYDSKLAKKAKLQSSFADLVTNNHRCTMLRHVFRNTLDSIAWVNDNIYKGKLKQLEWCRDHLTQRSTALKLFAAPGCGKAWVELDATKAPESKPEGSTSKVNMREAGVALQLVKKALKMSDIKAEQISVITLYAAQEREIRQRVMDCEELKEVKIGTIDAYQGKENELIIFLTTRSSPQASEFIKDTHRMNVMLTRHKAGVIGIGTTAMATCSPGWATLIHDYRQGGGLAPELQSHLDDYLEEETPAEAPIRIACISLPCELCMASKAIRLFETKDLRHGRPRWSPDKGGTYIEAKEMIKKGTNIFTVTVQEMHQREPPGYNTEKRSMAWYVRRAEETQESNVRWSHNGIKNTIYAHAMRDISQGEEIKGKEMAVELALACGTPEEKASQPQRADEESAQQEGPAAAQGSHPQHQAPTGAEAAKEAPTPKAAKEVSAPTRPLSIQETRDQREKERVRQFAAFERKITAREHRKKRMRRQREDSTNPNLACISTSIRDKEQEEEEKWCLLSYLHTGTPEGEDKVDQRMRRKWAHIASMRGARLAWEVADYPYLRHEEYPDRQEFFQQSYVLGDNDPISRIQRWWNQSKDGLSSRLGTDRARVHLAAGVRATALALKDLLYRLHSHHLQTSGQIRTSLDSARLDLEGVAYLLTDTAVSQIKEREVERQARVETTLASHRRERGKAIGPPSKYDPEEVGDRRQQNAPAETTTNHHLTHQSPTSEDDEAPRRQPHTEAALELILRAIIESEYGKKDEDAGALNEHERKIASTCKGWSQYRQRVHEWAQGDSGLPPRDNIGRRHLRAYQEEIEANVQRICTIGQTVRHCSRYITAQDAEQAEKETNKDRAKDLNDEMTKHHSNMVLAQIKLLAHEEARTKIGQLTAHNARSWDRSSRPADAKLQSRIEAWKITESRQSPGQHFNIEAAKEMLNKMPQVKIHTTYKTKAGEVEVKGLLGFLLKVDDGMMVSRVRALSPRRPTPIHSDEMHLRKQYLGTLHIPDNQRGMNLIHHSSQLGMTWKHRQPGATKWLDDKDETTGRVMDRKPANDEAFGLFNIDVQQQLPPYISCEGLTLRTENNDQDVWRVALKTKSPYIDQFVIIRIVTKSNKVSTYNYREQWDNKRQLQDEDEVNNVDAFFYALLDQQQERTCDHILAEWWTCMWTDNEKIERGESKDARITDRVRRAAGKIRSIPDPKERDHMMMPPDTGYILRYLRASQGGIQECQYNADITDEDTGMSAHQAMRKWMQDMHHQGGTIKHMPRCDMQALDDEQSTVTASPEFSIDRHLQGTGSEHEDHEIIYNIQTEEVQESKNPQITQVRRGDRGDSDSEDVDSEDGDMATLNEIAITDMSEATPIEPTAATVTDEHAQATESDPQVEDHESNKSTINEGKDMKEDGTKRVPEVLGEAPTQPLTWAERVRTAESGRVAPPPKPTTHRHEKPDGDLSHGEDTKWITVTNSKTRKHEGHHTESIDALDDDNFRAVYLHIHRRKVRRQREEEAVKLLRDTGIRRFTLPYINESKEQYEDKVTRMGLESSEGERATREYLQQERAWEKDDERSEALKSSEISARMSKHCEYNNEGRHMEWAEWVRKELTDLKAINLPTFHACRSLPRSGLLYNDRNRAEATELLQDWMRWGSRRQEKKNHLSETATKHSEGQDETGTAQGDADRERP